MFLNKSDLEKIRKYFQRTGVKDSDMPLTNAVNDSDCIVIVSNGQNKRITVELLKSHIEESTIPSTDPSQQLPGNIIAQEDGFYQIKGTSVYPLAHPDLSTQPSILPQRFGTLPIKEVIIPISPDEFSVPFSIIPKDAQILSANMFNKCFTTNALMYINQAPISDKWSVSISPQISFWGGSTHMYMTHSPIYLVVQYIDEGQQAYYNTYKNPGIVIDFAEEQYGDTGMRLTSYTSTGCGNILGILSALYPTYSDKKNLEGAIMRDSFGNEAIILSVRVNSSLIQSIVYNIENKIYEMTATDGIQQLN